MTGPDRRSLETRRYVRTVSGLVGASIVLFLAWSSRHSLEEIFSSADLPLLASAVAAGLGLVVVQATVFAQVAKKYGGRTSTRLSVLAFMHSQSAKYVPGKVWSVLAQKMTLGPDIRLITVTFANLELMAITLLQMTALGLVCLFLGAWQIWAAAAAAGWLVSAWFLRSELVLNVLLQVSLLRKFLEIGAVRPTLSRIEWPAALGTSGASMASVFIASWLVLLAMGQAVPTQLHVQVLGTLFLGFSAGMLAIIVPAGLGVREAATVVIGTATAPAVPPEMLLAITLFARTWQLLVDAASVLIAGAWLSANGRGGTGGPTI